MTDMTTKIKSEGRVDANNSWWVCELLAADCKEKKTWLHPGWEDTMLRWFSWLYEVKKKDEEKRMEVEDEKFNGVERRSADSEGGRRRSQAVGQM